MMESDPPQPSVRDTPNASISVKKALLQPEKVEALLPRFLQSCMVHHDFPTMPEMGYAGQASSAWHW